MSVTAPLPARPTTATLVLLGCVGVAAAHLAVLYTSGEDATSTSVAVLSRGPDGHLHGFGLLLFAVAQLALASLLDRPGAGWPTRLAQLFLAIDAALVVVVAYRFAASPEAVLRSTGPHLALVLLASGTGTAMAAAAPGLLASRRSAGYWDLACLALWLALLPLMLVVTPDWLGAYERLVGGVFVAWMAGLAVLVGFTTADHARADR